jgi:hypothetical protein
MVCIGSPLPQFGVPQRIQCFWFVIASQEFQKSGVIPAYVQFFRVQPHVVDAPRAIGFHENAVVGVGDQVIEFPCAGLQ